MRLAVALLVLVGGNLIGYVFWTRPALEERGRLESRRKELIDAVAENSEALSKWRRLEELVALAAGRLEPMDLARLRKAFLEAEEGLPLERDSLDLHPDGRVREQLQGVRIRVTQRGDYGSLVTYLRRLSGIMAPLAPLEMSLGPSTRDPASLTLSATWLALWPVEPGS